MDDYPWPPRIIISELRNDPNNSILYTVYIILYDYNFQAHHEIPITLDKISKPDLSQTEIRPKPDVRIYFGHTVFIFIIYTYSSQ